MSVKKHGLGRGLDALLPVEASSADAMLVAVEKIRRTPRQPRMAIDSGELEDLAASIREHGVIQPLIVSRGAVAEEYILIAGERRLEASKLAGLERVPVLVRDATDQQRLELALIENLQREDLSPLETAEAYRHLHEDFGLSHEEVARRVGKSRVTVSNTLRLLKLPERVRQALGGGQISEGHARAILALPTIQAQLAAVDTILKRDLSVRQTEELARRMTGKRSPKPSPPRLPPDLRALEKKFEEALGTRVTIKRGKRGGQVLLYYYSDEELDAIADQILKGK
jgi:ParB family chromosome partitioning protein